MHRLLFIQIIGLLLALPLKVDCFDGTCSATSPCPSGMCCSEWGWCGPTDLHCGLGCISNCGAVNSALACGANQPCTDGLSCSDEGQCEASSTNTTTSWSTPLVNSTASPLLTRPAAAPSATGNDASFVAEGGCAIYTADVHAKSFAGNAPELRPFIDQAVVEFGICTAPRLAAFLGTIAHETASLTVFFQPADCGAGAIHMIPANWHLIFQLPGRDFSDLLHDGFAGSPNNTGPEATQAMQQPQFMFRVGGAWFSQMAALVLGDACDGLIGKLDGIPSDPALTTLEGCVFGHGYDLGDATRRAHVLAAFDAITRAGDV